ncbi:MAG: tRNA uridine-5-carboxymethylaminomethyl(34) synthesis GTPase MnmE, partial [Phycisphaeraceae bacterium]|nr:tRNA uridine-5-carboxymethylaminomethyl(34) synthesis GTPase MnmE [Phycisphaeraceae bacterium]
EEADLVLLVLDGTRPLDPIEVEALEQADRSRTVVAVNKGDLPQARCGELPYPSSFEVSARTGEGLDALRRELRERLVGGGPIEDPILTNSRHARALEQAEADLARAATAAAKGLSEELLLEDLRQAMRHLGEITGEFTTEDLYDRIFSSFCIGK